MKHSKTIPFLIILGGSIPVVIEIAQQYGIPMNAVVIFAVVAGLVAGAMALWVRANASATGDEWWQDDHCSGWRGY